MRFDQLCGDLPLQGAIEKVAGPKDLFQALYHHFLCLADRGLQLGVPTQDIGGAPATPNPGPSVAAGVQADAEAERVLCIRAMAAVYTKHAGLLGSKASKNTFGEGLPYCIMGSTACACL